MSDSVSPHLSAEHPTCVREVQAISAVGKILETIAMLTGLRFVAVAHVTEVSWTTCAVLDKLGFGLRIGDELDVATTLCKEVRDSASAIVIDHVSESARYCDHHTPRMYGFESYFSIPIRRQDGNYFGSLCGLDPNPAALSAPATLSTLELFAQLISVQLEAERVHAGVLHDLQVERETAELREQFIAVLGHDLRTPLGVLQYGVDLLHIKHRDPATLPVLARMRRSIGRMGALVDDVVDFTRGRMGSGMQLTLRHEPDLAVPLGQVIDELRELHPERTILAPFGPALSVLCDVGRLSQLLSNLLKNAIVHGKPGTPVTVAVGTHDGRFSIEVSNHGAPLPPALVEQLFKPFWRSPPNQGQKGLGLGLYVVAEIARAHGGTVDVISRDGLVSFRLSMPHRPRLTKLTAV